MERAVYCYGWLPGRPNCHPVHTMKHIGMIEELEKNRATMLSWSMMGSGAISLPFLERQIYGEIPPQLRFHGYLNDKEFNEECLKRGILPYAVVYQAQGWEFPVVLNEDETEIMEMNILHSGKEPKTYGLTEFTQDKYHTVFNKVFADYFPEGIYNSEGELVTDLYEECTSRNLYGVPTHSHWLEVTGLTQTCYGMCRNNPVWRTYLKKIVEIQIEAGARAVQLDECETPICSIGYGGCFCKDCMKQFRVFLKKKKAEGMLPKAMDGIDLDTFDYAEYLRERHIDWPNDFMNIPFSDLYWEFQVETHNRHFKEIISYVKQYGKEKKGLDIKVSGNFTNMHLLYLPCLEDVDCCITELRRTVFHRHNWFRLAVGYTQDKPLILAESPYDGFMPKFVELVSRGKADDYYRLFIMEAAIHGCSMAFPFGAWMGNDTKDCFQPPYKVGTQVQEYLYRHDDLLSKRSGANVLVLYSYQSYMERDWQCGHGENLDYKDKDDLLSYFVTYDERASRMPFFEVTQKMTDGQVAYDVLVLGNGGAVPDTFKAEDLEQYDMVVIPDCDWMTENQVAVIKNYANEHSVFVYGKYAENQPDALETLKNCKSSVIVEDIANAEASIGDFMASFHQEYENRRQLFCDNKNIYLQKAITEKGMVVHFLNYAFDTERYQTIAQDAIIDVKVEPAKRIETYTLSGEALQYEILESSEQGKVRLKLKNVPCYGAVLFRD